jgi:hypothetical protein
VTQPEQVLGVPGLVETVGLVEQLDRGRVAVHVGTHDGGGHVARDRPEQRERYQGHQQQHDDGLKQPTHHEQCHLLPPECTGNAWDAPAFPHRTPDDQAGHLTLEQVVKNLPTGNLPPGAGFRGRSPGCPALAR